MKRWVGCGLMFAGLWRSAPGQTNGIFADFSTSKGAFTVWLDYERAPRAVAGFVGLATGEGGWLDAQSNVWHRPFYDGSLFHRVAKVVETNNSVVETNGIAVQGGGRPDFYMTSIYESGTVSTNVHSTKIVTTNAIGVGTNTLTVAVRTTNVAAVATNYVTGTNVIATNAPTVTYVSLAALVVSSNALKTVVVTNTSMKYAVYTNYSLSAQVTTNISQTSVVTTNAVGNIVYSHTLQVEEVASTFRVLRVEATNFVGPGYTMLESVTNGLAHSNGVISMANSGPNTDGSQFFITTTNVPGWNGSYSVFGHVTAGMNAVTSIAAVAVQGAGSRPVTDVVLSNVVIRREGEAAKAFDVSGQGVPSPESAPVRLSSEGTNIVFAVELANQTKPLMFSDAIDVGAFSGWDHQTMIPGLGFYTNASTVLTQKWAAADLGQRHFFHASRVRYPPPITAPASHRGRVYTFVWSTAPVVTNRSHFGPNDMTPGVSYEWTGTNAVVTNQLLSGFEAWTQDAYSAYLVSLDSRFYYYYYSLGFNPGVATNRFTCRRVNGVSGATVVFSGTFTVQ